MKFSAHTELSGVTVLEPMILNEPVSAGSVDTTGVVAVPLLHPAKRKSVSIIAESSMNHIFLGVRNLYPPYIFYPVSFEALLFIY